MAHFLDTLNSPISVFSMPLEKMGGFVGYEVDHAPLLSPRYHLQIDDQTDGNRKGSSLGCGQGAQELPNSVFDRC
jgi:hypothetical protein